MHFQQKKSSRHGRHCGPSPQKQHCGHEPQRQHCAPRPQEQHCGPNPQGRRCGPSRHEPHWRTVHGVPALCRAPPSSPSQRRDTGRPLLTSPRRWTSSVMLRNAALPSSMHGVVHPTAARNWEETADAVRPCRRGAMRPDCAQPTPDVQAEAELGGETGGLWARPVGLPVFPCFFGSPRPSSFPRSFRRALGYALRAGQGMAARNPKEKSAMDPCKGTGGNLPGVPKGTGNENWTPPKERLEENWRGRPGRAWGDRERGKSWPPAGERLEGKLAAYRANTAGPPVFPDSLLLLQIPYDAADAAMLRYDTNTRSPNICEQRAESDTSENSDTDLIFQTAVSLMMRTNSRETLKSPSAERAARTPKLEQSRVEYPFRVPPNGFTFTREYRAIELHR
eukprot:gene16660-biopygen11017